MYARCIGLNPKRERFRITARTYLAPRALLRGRGRAWPNQERTLLLVARFFRVRWLPFVAYRQLAWAWHAARPGRLREHLAGVRMALPLIGAFLRERGDSAVAVEDVVPRVPIRGPRAGGHPSRHVRS